MFKVEIVFTTYVKRGDCVYNLCSKWRLCLQPMFKVEIVFTTEVQSEDCVYNPCSKWRLCLQPMFKDDTEYRSYSVYFKFTLDCCMLFYSFKHNMYKQIYSAFFLLS